MSFKKKGGRLTPEEQVLVKSLLLNGWRNQDITALINLNRQDTVNSARITEVKNDDSIKTVDKETLDFLLEKKQAIDFKTGLNIYEDERLIRAREAMILAVHVFNNPSIQFKTEVFAVLANIAWTYLMHEFYIRENVKIEKPNGYTLSLREMLDRNDCPLSRGIKNNLLAIKIIRDEVEHKLFGRSDASWFGKFQACCLNFDRTITEFFGEKLSLQKDLTFSLQFAKPNLEQLYGLSAEGLPPIITAINKKINKKVSKKDQNDLEFEFKVIYTLVSTTKSQAHIKFIHPDSEKGKEITNVLIKPQLADEVYPYKRNKVVKLVNEQSVKPFTTHNHTQAMYLYKVRPKPGTKHPENTTKKYCIYHSAHNDYTYSEEWIKFLINQIKNDEEYKKIKEFEF